MTRLLIVNADDFGLTEGVSRGILRAHRDGIVTSVSVLPVAPAFAESAPLLRSYPDLGAGVHLALVGEDPPLSPASRVRSLVDESGRFPTDWKAFVRRSPRARSREIEEELGAQIEAARASVPALDHLDAHQHLHLFPRVRRAVLRLAKRFAIRGVRVTHSRLRRPPGVAVGWLARGLARAARREGLAYPDACEGFDQAGRMDRGALLQALRRAAGRGRRVRSVEVLTHPGEAEDPARVRYPWDYSWGAELAALVDPEVRDEVARLGLRLGTYRDLP